MDSSHHRKAVVLGPQALRGTIARDLEREGFEAVDAQVLGELPDPHRWFGTEQLERILVDFRAAGGTTIHPGVGVWADRPELYTVGQKCGLEVIGPSVQAITIFGNKLTLAVKAAELGIPTLLISDQPIHSSREIAGIVEGRKYPFPLVLKSIRGRGRQGLFVVHGPEDMDRRLPLWLDQLRTNLGEALVYGERYMEASRMMTVPFCRFANGEVQIFPISDSSLMHSISQVD